ncbi:hypothetical protein SNEBB_001498 [Seison nebaliae]|nr:hypothetical protein SNEBB_001498 [Seison nebaliae]
MKNRKRRSTGRSTLSEKLYKDEEIQSSSDEEELKKIVNRVVDGNEGETEKDEMLGKMSEYIGELSEKNLKDDLVNPFDLCSEINCENIIISRKTLGRSIPIAMTLSMKTEELYSIDKKNDLRRFHITHTIQDNCNRINLKKYFVNHKRQFTAPTTIDVNGNNEFGAVGDVDGCLTIWKNVEDDMKILERLNAHRQSVTTVKFRRHSKMNDDFQINNMNRSSYNLLNELFSGGKDGVIRTWNCATLLPIRTFVGHHSVVSSIDIFSNDRFISAGSTDNSIRCWKVEEESQLIFNTSKYCVDVLAYLNNNLFVGGTRENSILLFHVNKKNAIFTKSNAHTINRPTIDEHKSSELPYDSWITAMSTIPSSNLFVSGNVYGEINMWKLKNDMRSFTLLRTIDQFYGVVNSLCLTRNYLVVVLAKENGVGRWICYRDKKIENALLYRLRLGNANFSHLYSRMTSTIVTTPTFKNKNEIDSVIFGIENYGRCITPTFYQFNESWFMTGTQVNLDRSIFHLLSIDGDRMENGIVDKYSFDFSHGDIWSIRNCTEFPSLTAIKYNRVSSNQYDFGIWKIEEELIEKKDMESISLDEAIYFGEERINSFEWKPLFSQQFVQSIDNEAKIFDFDNNNIRPIVNWKIGSGNINSIEWSPHFQSSLIGLLSTNSFIYFYDIRQKLNTHQLSTPNYERIQTFDFNRKSCNFFASGGSDGSVKVWDMRKLDREIKKFSDEWTHWISSVSYNPLNDNFLLASSYDGQVLLYNIINLEEEDDGKNGRNRELFDVHEIYGNEDDDKHKDKDKMKCDEIDEIEIPEHIHKELLTDRIISSYRDHEESVYGCCWSNQDAWLHASISFDGRIVFRTVPKHEKYNWQAYKSFLSI